MTITSCNNVINQNKDTSMEHYLLVRMFYVQVILKQREDNKLKWPEYMYWDCKDPGNPFNLE